MQRYEQEAALFRVEGARKDEEIERERRGWRDGLEGL